MYKNVINFASSLLSFKTKRKLVVFEVDDYGSCHYDNTELLKSFLKKNDRTPFFIKYDRLSNAYDLENLFDVLTSVRDSKGNHAVFTPLMITANPNRQKIIDANYDEYHFENAFESIMRIHGQATIALWKEGIEKMIFLPQYHGREHLHIQSWMSQISKKDSFTRKSFDQGLYFFADDSSKLKGYKSSATYGFKDSQEITTLESSLIDGIKLMKSLVGYLPVSFTPPAGGYSYLFEKALYNEGIRSVSVGRKHAVINAKAKRSSKFHYLGQQSKNNIIYTPRNVLFEPHNQKYDAVLRAVHDIEQAFKYKQPAIISSHRINFVNNENSFNGDGIIKLKSLLSKIIKKWPNVEFISSSELVRILLNRKNV